MKITIKFPVYNIVISKDGYLEPYKVSFTDTNRMQVILYKKNWQTADKFSKKLIKLSEKK